MVQKIQRLDFIEPPPPVHAQRAPGDSLAAATADALTAHVGATQSAQSLAADMQHRNERIVEAKARLEAERAKLAAAVQREAYEEAKQVANTRLLVLEPWRLSS